MSDAKIIVAVCGDPAVDVYQETIPHPKPENAKDGDDSNWYRRPGHRQYQMGGGVLLLSDMIKRAVKRKLPTFNDANFKIPEFNSFQSCTDQAEIVQALAHIVDEQWDEKYGPKPEDPQKAWFVDRFHGFSLLPAVKRSTGAEPVPPTGEDASDPRIAVAVLDDGGNGFRDNRTQWPDWLSDENRSFGLVILKLSPPLRVSKSPISALFDRFTSMTADRKVIVLNGVDLRDDRAGISGKLSWERTAADLVRFIDGNRTSYSLLKSGADLIIRFGIEGTAYVSSRAISGHEPVYLIADPSRIEDSVDVEVGYGIAGCTSVFVAALVASAATIIASDELSKWSVIEAINDAMDPAFLLRTRGMRVTVNDDTRNISFPDLIFDKEASDPKAKILKIPKRSVFKLNFGASSTKDATSGPLGRIDDRFGNLRPIAHATAPSVLLPDQKAVTLAQAVVLLGEKALEVHTHAKFGKMLQVDWREVESYRYVANLMRKYLKGEEARPLSLAVFGAPGSGKSYGITEISKTMSGAGKGPTIPQLTFNIAQWRSADDLHVALHQVRDRAIAGDVPLVFFDEFDSATDVDLGWLRLFLAPMQDGEFSDGKHVHKIGKAILVFAGGTKDSFEKFNLTSADGKEEPEMQVSDKNAKPARKTDSILKFKNAKGPDFISRLSGFVNIQNLDRSANDEIWMLRRAVVLRGLLEKHFKSIFDRDNKADFDGDVLDAFLTVPRFNHGIRSVEAILRMSSANASSVRFAKADLPPTGQLALHVDPTAFLNAAKIL